MRCILEEQIELTRQELNAIALEKGISSKETIEVSEELDCLLNALQTIDELPG